MAVEPTWYDTAPVLAGHGTLQRAQRARAASIGLQQRCSAAMARSLTVWEQALDTLAACHKTAARGQAAATSQDGTAGFDLFEVEGLVNERPVTGSWIRGRLVCHPTLRARAELLVDLEEVFSDQEGRPCYMASLDGPAVAVALTLVRACDQVTKLALGISPS